jgi:hypothetical protein
MAIDDLGDESIKNMIKNYEAKGLTTGGRFPLDVLRRELREREAKPLGVKATFDAIIDLVKLNETHTTTYLALWNRLSDGRRWEGNNTQQQLGKALGGVVAHCIGRQLPILTVLVLPRDGQITKKAKENIYKECIKLGIKTSRTADDFYAEQLEKASRYIQTL